MAEKEKKRKRPAEHVKSAGASNKRHASVPTTSAASPVNVSFENTKDRLHPAIGKSNWDILTRTVMLMPGRIASSPGLNAPQIPFKAYGKPNDAGHSSSVPSPVSHSLLLHSSAHPKLDYIAGTDSNKHLDHYIGVYDPASSTLKLVPAHAVTLRSTLRSAAADVGVQKAARTFARQREDLGMEFGTKKAKKALASRTVNAITGPTEQGVEAAVLDSVKEASNALPVRDEQQGSILAAKPIPKANLDASTVEDVYPLSRLVPPVDVRTLAVKDWQDAVKQGLEVKLGSRFVANRLQAVVAREDVQTLKALKYLLLLLDFYGALGSGRGAGKKVPMKDKLREKLAAWPENMVENVRRRFAEGGYVYPRFGVFVIFV